MIYPLTVTEFEKLLSLSFRHWFKTLGQIFIFIFLFTLAKAATVYLPPLGVLLDTLIGIVMAALTLLLFSLALYRADALLRGQPVSLLESWQAVIKQILYVFAAGLVFTLGMILIFFLAKWFVFSLFKLKGLVAVFAVTGLGGLPVFIGLIFFYLTIPLIVVDKETLWMAFYRSADLTQQNWLYVFALYTTMVIILILLMPQTRHSHWLVEHHFMEVFDLVVLILILPFLINLTLFILRNFQIKEERS